MFQAMTKGRPLLAPAIDYAEKDAAAIGEIDTKIVGTGEDEIE